MTLTTILEDFLRFFPAGTIYASNRFKTIVAL